MRKRSRYWKEKGPEQRRLAEMVCEMLTCRAADVHWDDDYGALFCCYAALTEDGREIDTIRIMVDYCSVRLFVGGVHHEI